MSGEQETIQTPWGKSSDEILDRYPVEEDEGLSEEEVRARLQSYGPNKLKESKRRSRWIILADQFKNFLVILLAIAAAVALAIHEILEGVSIVVVLVVNAVIGFVTETKAVSSMEALREMTKIDAHVRREGEVRKI